MSENIYALFAKIKGENNSFAPLTAEIDVTFNCPCKCVHCYQELNRVDPKCELTTTEILKCIDELHDMGTFECIISGGDPLCRKDIWEILGYLKQKKIRTVLYTSGYFLDAETCERIAKLRIARIEMTLLGTTETTHDRICRRPGAFGKICEGVKMLKTFGLPLRIKYMLMHDNYGDLERLNEVEAAFGEHIDVIPYLWCKQGGTEDEIAQLRITEKELEQYYAVYPFAKRDISFLSCNAGKYKISIDALGNIKPCSAFASDCGIANIRSDSLKNVWETNPFLLHLRRTVRYPNVECRRCDKSEFCTLCPAIATWAGMKYSEKYPAMCKYAEVARRMNYETL